MTTKKTRTISTNERGASLVEYCLLLSLIALVCFSAVEMLGIQVNIAMMEAALDTRSSGFKYECHYDEGSSASVLGVTYVNVICSSSRIIS